METYHGKYWFKKVVGELLPILAPMALHFHIYSSFLCYAVPSSCTTSGKGKFCFSFMTESKHHFLQKNRFPTHPLRKSGQVFSLYILIVSSTYCITDSIWASTCLSNKMIHSWKTMTMSYQSSNSQCQRWNGEIWKDSTMWNFIKLMGPICYDNHPHSIIFCKILYTKRNCIYYGIVIMLFIFIN